MKVILDASAIVPLFVNDHFTDRIRTFLIANQPELTMSDFAAAEFASVVARRVRTRDITQDEARAAFAGMTGSPNAGTSLVPRTGISVCPGG